MTTLHPTDEEGMRAREFFLSHLTYAQQVEWLTKGHLTVRGGITGTKYKIVGRMTNHVMSYDTQYCVWLNHTPLYDSFLAEKLMIEHHERQFLETAVASVRLSHRMFVTWGTVAAIGFAWWLMFIR